MSSYCSVRESDCLSRLKNWCEENLPIEGLLKTANYIGLIATAVFAVAGIALAFLSHPLSMPCLIGSGGSALAALAIMVLRVLHEGKI